MTSLCIWTMIFGGALVTYALRLSFILLLERLTLPDLVIRALRYVPAAVLSALVWPALVYKGTTLYISYENPRLLAGLVAAVVAWRTGNILLTISMGMASLWLLQWLGW